MVRLKIVAVTVALCGCMASAVHASQTVKLDMAFLPDRQGASTTVQAHFTITTSAGQVPSPVTYISLNLPRGISLGSSELGLETCSAAALELFGPEGCSPNAVVGLGSALSEVPYGPIIVSEPVTITIYLASPVDGHTAMLFYVNGRAPVSAQLIFPAFLLPGGGPPGSASLDTVVPLTPSLPGAPDASVVDIRTSIGPLHLTYYRLIHGRRTAFRPAGIAIPAHCPAGGFRFNASFSFQDGTTASSGTAVPCPRRR